MELWRRARSRTQVERSRRGLQGRMYEDEDEWEDGGVMMRTIDEEDQVLAPPLAPTGCSKSSSRAPNHCHFERGRTLPCVACTIWARVREGRQMRAAFA